MAESQLAWTTCAVWVAWHVLIVVRFRNSSSLNSYAPVTDANAPLVSVVVPARNEARNIGACVESLLAATYPRFEIIVVDDHSEDGTGDIARRAAASAPAGRVRVINAPPLPEGWFGKQWACQSGAAEARGELLLFTDADTRHGPELLTRSVSAMQARGANLLTVAGRQEMGSFWERVIQPFVFAILLSRYGGLDEMSANKNPRNKIANGQYLLFDRATYDAVGRHESVRTHVAEDLLLAQRVTKIGRSMQMVLGREHLSTRMYTSLNEIRRGWGKNVFAAGKDTMPGGAVVHAIVRWVYPMPALVALLPTLLLVLLALGMGDPAFVAPVWVAQGITFAFWVGVYAFTGLNPLWALTYPLAALVFGFILGEAAWRGNNVEWKGRAYVSRS